MPWRLHLLQNRLCQRPPGFLYPSRHNVPRAQRRPVRRTLNLANQLGHRRLRPRHKHQHLLTVGLSLLITQPAPPHNDAIRHDQPSLHAGPPPHNRQIPQPPPCLLIHSHPRSERQQRGAGGDEPRIHSRGV